MHRSAQSNLPSRLGNPQCQREGTQAGALVPMTGEQAALGYQRYLDSFRFALPEFYTGQADATTARAGSAGQPIGR